MWSAQAVRDSKIGHTQRHLSNLTWNPKHVIVQWVSIGSYTHTLQQYESCFQFYSHKMIFKKYTSKYVIRCSYSETLQNSVLCNFTTKFRIDSKNTKPQVACIFSLLFSISLEMQYAFLFRGRPDSLLLNGT